MGEKMKRTVVTSPLKNTRSSYHSVATYQTGANCIVLHRLGLAWLQILARLKLARLPNTPYMTGGRGGITL
jgi:hypothetical protein